MSGKESTPVAGLNMADPVILNLIQEFTKALNNSNNNNNNNNRSVPRTTEPPVYDGARDAVVIDSWIRTLERYSGFQDWDQVQTKNYAVTLLRGRADTWYRTLETGNGDEPEDWLSFKRELVDFFRPDDASRLARDKLAVYRQTGSLNDYINGYMDIIASIPGITEEESCDKFMRGIANRDTRSQVRQAQASTLREAIRVAIAHDSAIHENPVFYRKNPNSFNNFGSSRSQSSRGPYAGEPMDLSVMASSSKSNIRCHYCGRTGHIRRFCKTRSEDIKKLEEDRFRKLQKGGNTRKDFQ